jgi:hypothetical protein
MQYEPITPEQQSANCDDSIDELFEVEQELLSARLKASHAAGEPALRRLVDLCETRDSGQPRYVARLLAGLYNGKTYPFDLSDLRCLDAEIQDDIFALLRMDSCPAREVHRYFDDGEKRFNAIFQKFGVKRINRA